MRNIRRDCVQAQWLHASFLTVLPDNTSARQILRHLAVPLVLALFGRRPIAHEQNYSKAVRNISKIPSAFDFHVITKEVGHFPPRSVYGQRCSLGTRSSWVLSSTSASTIMSSPRSSLSMACRMPALGKDYTVDC